jgi:hypothetical protein
MGMEAKHFFWLAKFVCLQARLRKEIQDSGPASPRIYFFFLMEKQKAVKKKTAGDLVVRMV